MIVLLLVLACAPKSGAPAEGGAPELTPDEAVRQTVKDHYGEIAWCYERALDRNPFTRGRLELELVVEGTVITTLTPTSDTLGDPQLTSCITERVQRWTFPPQVQGKVRWPFAFQPS